MAAECGLCALDKIDTHHHHHHRSGPPPPTHCDQTPTRDPRRGVPSAELLSRLSWTVPGRAARGRPTVAVLHRSAERERARVAPEMLRRRFVPQVPAAARCVQSLFEASLPTRFRPMRNRNLGVPPPGCTSSTRQSSLTGGTQLILRIPDLLLNLKLPAIQTPGQAQARQARLCHRRANKPGIV